MPKYVFAYHGGKMPETPEEGAKEMEKWKTWFASMGSAVIDGGNPVGKSTTVSGSGVVDNGGSNPLSGYSLIEVPDLNAAIKIAKGCPICSNDGSVEIAEAIDMEM